MRIESKGLCKTSIIMSLLLATSRVEGAETPESDDAPKKTNDQPSESITVKGKRIREIKAQEASQIDVLKEEAELVAPSGDVAQVPKLLPGAFTRPNESEVSVRGSDKEDSLYLIDDLEVPNLFEPITGTSVVPSKAIRSLSFTPGNFDAAYGDASGGVITLRTRTTEIREPYSEFRLNLPIYSSAYHERPLGEGGTMIASVRKSTLEPFVRLATKDNEDVELLVPYFDDAYLQYHKTLDSSSYRVRYIHSKSGAKAEVYNDNAQDTSGTSKFNFETSYDLVGFNYEKNGQGVDWDLNPYLVKSQSAFSTSGNFFNIQVQSISVPLRARFNVSENFTLFSGVQVTYTDYDLRLRLPDTIATEGFDDSENAPRIKISIDSQLRKDAGWLSGAWEYGPLLISPSVRVFRQSTIDEASFDPRLSVQYNFGLFESVRFGYGSYSTAPSPEKLAAPYGNPKLPWTRSLHASVGWETRIFDQWSSDVQVYRKDWRDIPREDAVERFRPDTERWSQGLEWFLRLPDDGELFGWLSYTYSMTREDRGAKSKNIPSDTDVAHIVQLVGNYRLSDSWQLGGRAKYQSGYVYTPVGTVWYQAATDTYAPEEDPALINSKRVPDTGSFSLFAQKESEFTGWTLVTRFGFEEYQFNRSSPNFSYNYDYTEKEFSRGIPVIPFVELRAIL